jgi:hypothetical protein
LPRRACRRACLSALASPRVSPRLPRRACLAVRGVLPPPASHLPRVAPRIPPCLAACCRAYCHVGGACITCPVIAARAGSNFNKWMPARPIIGQLIYFE